jgi:hypothetical protein
MKIMICGSMSFSKEMLEAKKKLEGLGHSVKVPCDVDLHLDDSGFIDNLDADYEHCIENNIMKTCMDKIAESDAILVMNHSKNGVNGYVGTSSLMEIGLAYYLEKKIFLLFPTPLSSEARWAHEVRIMQPVVLDGDLSKI